MTRLALALTLAAAPALADVPPHLPQGSNDCTPLAERPGAVTQWAGGDMLVLAPHPSAAAKFCYWNGNQVSRHGDWPLSIDGLRVEVFVNVGDAEVVTVSPPPGFMVFPADAAQSEVQDNGSVTALIIMGVS